MQPQPPLPSSLSASEVASLEPEPPSRKLVSSTDTPTPTSVGLSDSQSRRGRAVGGVACDTSIQHNDSNRHASFVSPNTAPFRIFRFLTNPLSP